MFQSSHYQYYIQASWVHALLEITKRPPPDVRPELFAFSFGTTLQYAAGTLAAQQEQACGSASADSQLWCFLKNWCLHRCVNFACLVIFDWYQIFRLSARQILAASCSRQRKRAFWVSSFRFFRISYVFLITFASTSSRLEQKSLQMPRTKRIAHRI